MILYFIGMMVAYGFITTSKDLKKDSLFIKIGVTIFVMGLWPCLLGSILYEILNKDEANK